MSWLGRKPARNPGQEAYAALLAVMAQLGADVERLAGAFEPAIAATVHVQSILETVTAARVAGDTARADEAQAQAVALLETLQTALKNGRQTMRDGAALIRTAGVSAGTR